MIKNEYTEIILYQRIGKHKFRLIVTLPSNPSSLKLKLLPVNLAIVIYKNLAVCFFELIWAQNVATGVYCF